MQSYAQTDLGLKLINFDEFTATLSQSRPLKSQSALWRKQSLGDQRLSHLEIFDSIPLEIITLGQSRRCVDNQMDIFNEGEARAITSYGWRMPSNYALYSGGGVSSPATEPRALLPRARLSPKQASFMRGPPTSPKSPRFRLGTAGY